MKERMLLRRWMAVFAVVMAAAVVLIGCASTAPTAWEQKWYDIQTNLVERVVLVTNRVPVYETNVMTVEVRQTNTVNQVEVIPVTVTNVVVVPREQVVLVTNVVEEYDYRNGTNVAALQETAKGVAGLWGPWGEVIGILIGAAFGTWGMMRSSKSGKTAAALAQIIETGRKVLQTTPQGQQLDQAWKVWMMQHQAETGTMLEVVKLLEKVVDSESARKVAGELAGMIEERQAK